MGREFVYAVKNKITDEELRDLIIDGIETGITYWAMLDNNTEQFEKYYETTEMSTSEIVAEIILNGGSVKITDIEDCEEPKYNLTLERLLAGADEGCKSGFSGRRHVRPGRSADPFGMERPLWQCERRKTAMPCNRQSGRCRACAPHGERRCRRPIQRRGAGILQCAGLLLLRQGTEPECACGKVCSLCLYRCTQLLIGRSGQRPSHRRYHRRLLGGGGGAAVQSVCRLFHLR